MKPVLVESPFAGDVKRNIKYTRKCMHDCFLRGEAPFASHALYTQEGVLDDTIPEERELGIKAGLIWGAMAEVTVVYVDHGILGGMRLGIADAKAKGRPVEYRKLYTELRKLTLQEWALLTVYRFLAYILDSARALLKKVRQ